MTAQNLYGYKASIGSSTRNMWKLRALIQQHSRNKADVFTTAGRSTKASEWQIMNYNESSFKELS